MGRFSALQRLDIGFHRRLTVGSPSVRYVSWEYTGCVFFSYMQIFEWGNVKKLIFTGIFLKNRRF